MEYDFNWGILAEQPYLRWLVAGAGSTLLLAACIWTVAFIAGSAVGVAATTERRGLRYFATAYVELLRNIPPVVHLFIWYFVVPEALPAGWGQYVKREMPHPEFLTSVVALGLFLSSRIAEQVRAGIQAIPALTVQAALATGLTKLQTYRYVRLPLAYRILVPTLGSEMMICLKLTAVSLTIGLLEMTARAHEIESFTGNGIEAFAAATLFYVAAATLLVAGISLAERWARVSR